LQELKIVAKNNIEKNVLIDVFIIVVFVLRCKDPLIDALKIEKVAQLLFFNPELY